MYAILRTKKLKDAKEINECFAHNLRTRLQSNIDVTRMHKNKVLINSFRINDNKATDFRKKMMNLYKNLGIHIREDNVLAREFVVTASPDFFEGKTDKQVDEWAKHQVDFMKEKFGDNMRFAILHLDEKTPHIHFVMTAEQKVMRKYKNRYGVGEKEYWQLNSKWINPSFLRKLQTEFAKHNTKYGLKRGVHNSDAKHVAPLEYTKELSRELKITQEQNENQKLLLERIRGEQAEVERLRAQIEKIVGETNRLKAEAEKDKKEAERLKVATEKLRARAKDELAEAREKNQLANTFGGFVGEVVATVKNKVSEPSPEVIAKLDEAKRRAERERNKRKDLEQSLEKQKDDHNRQLQDWLSQKERLDNIVTNTTNDLERSNKEIARLREQLSKHERPKTYQKQHFP